jgi:hypothetical protein
VKVKYIISTFSGGAGGRGERGEEGGNRNLKIKTLLTETKKGFKIYFTTQLQNPPQNFWKNSNDLVARFLRTCVHYG